MSSPADEIEYLSQGVDYLGFLSQQLGDLQGMASLAHELIQNADDAKDEAGQLAAREIVFDVTVQRQAKLPPTTIRIAAF